MGVSETVAKCGAFASADASSRSLSSMVHVVRGAMGVGAESASSTRPVGAVGDASFRRSSPAGMIGRVSTVPTRWPCRSGLRWLNVAQAEAGRCMSCGYCFDCEKCWLFCQDQAIDKPLEKGALYSFNMQTCTRCGKCSKECPCGFIDML